MRLATIRTASGTAAVRVDDEVAVHLGANDVGTFLADPDWRGRAASAAGETFAVGDLDYAPLVPRAGKVICIGLNYRNHILEMGHDLPAYPTLFTKYASSLIGAGDEIILPPESAAVDWEAELAVVIGSPVRRADPAAAAAAIAGYSVLNDISMRDWQNRTSQFDQGKCWESSTPVGPWLVTAEAGDPEPAAAISCRVDDEVVQSDSTAHLLFGPHHLVAYISTILTLEPGDLIATGTPGGVGHARRPPRYLAGGMTVTTAIEGIGVCTNRCRVDTGA